MIPTATEEITTTGDLGGQKIAMQLDVTSTRHLMSLLTDLYSDPEKAVIREYATNAIDSHVEAGQTRPIEVTTPSALDPNFRVQDFGTGLSIKEIEEVWSRYGASTKRETDEQTGMLGLGCKSALTLVSQFFVHSVKNGLKVQASVYRDEEGQGIVEIVDTRATDEPNGVEIVVPVRQSPGFMKKVNDFFMYWKPGTVIVDGKEPTLPSTTRIVNDNFWMDTSAGSWDNSGPDIVVMGNVSYPIDKDKGGYARNQNRFRRNVRLIHFVEIGEVAFTPSREALYYSELTISTLRRLAKETSESVLELAQRDIAEQTNAADAVEVMLKWSDSIMFDSTRPFEWNDLVMETNWREKVHVFKSERSRNQVVSESYLDLRALMHPNALLVTNWGTSTPSKRQKDKMRQYVLQKGIIINTYFLFEKTVPGSPWTDNLEAVDWAVINKVTLPKRQYSGTGRGDGGYETLEAGWKSSVHDFHKKTLCWAKRGEYLDKQAMAELFPDTDFVVLTENRIDKFQRLFPHAVNLHDLAAKAYVERVNKLTTIQKQHRGMKRQGRDISFFMSFDDTRVDDPEFAELVRIAHATDDPTIDRLARMVYATKIGETVEPWVAPPRYDWKVVYPLINERWYGTSYVDDIYLYMNAKYAQLQEANK